DKVIAQIDGGTNANGVPSGGTITYQYETLASPLPGDTTTLARRTTVIDRNGNTSEYEYNQFNDPLTYTEFNNRGIRAGDPASFLTKYSYDPQYRLIQEFMPEGNSILYPYDSSNPARFQQGNLLPEAQIPDAARGGDQASITTTYTYEPIYNQVHTMTEPRGN